ncbi:TetR/AcrR family transcriptional regulator [Rhodococcus sp. D2-41]|uniref:TetR/AcrR family transcriptional regulator n=1 Tax=Speluncibacter jeojiensis TaxID=2710754 RepID=UPI00240FC06A|nr:TetR/AcrR family transcriptional regulator [Rhodococcus sp. D2-41]MDG3010142.1 TetR/AcrR family transcriptional regulator [Rhodococcus sp. D2-41]
MQPDERREQILDVAAAHFSQIGYDGTSMSRIARDADITRALVYHYFPNKDVLLDAVLRRESAALLAATSPQPGLSVRSSLERALAAYFSHFAASAGGLRNLYAPTAQSPALVWEIAALNHEIQVDRLIAATRQPDTPSLRLIFAAWLAFVETAAQRAATDTGVISPEGFVRLCLDVFATSTGLDLDAPE